MTSWLDTAYAWELHVNGTDVWQYLLSNTLRATLFEAGQIGTLAFELEDTSNVLEITEWQEVVLYAGAGKAIWGGYAVTVTPDLGAGEFHRRWMVRCESYDTILNHGKEVRRVWLDQTPGQILTDLLDDADITDFDISGISTGTALDSFAANGEKNYEIVNRLAEAAGFVWSIEADKDFVFGLPGSMISSPVQIAPFATANFTSTFPPLSLSIQRDASDVANYVTVRGATMPSEPYTDLFLADGVAERWQFTHRPIYDVLTVHLDSVLQTFGIDGFDDDGLYPFMVNLTLGYIRSTTGPLTLASELSVSYRYDVVVSGLATSLASYTYFGDRWFYLTVQDPTIFTATEAQDLAKTVLAEKEYGTISITAEIDRIGVYPTQKWTPTFPVLGLNGIAVYTVRQVTIEVDRETAFVRCTVKAGGKAPSLRATVEGISDQRTSSSLEYGIRSRKDWKAVVAIVDHGGLSGLGDDDHTQYLLATGTRTGAGSQAQAFTNGVIGPSWKPASDSTTALQMQNAAGAAIATIDTTNSRLVLASGVPIFSASNSLLHRYGTNNLFLGIDAGNFTLTTAIGNAGFGAYTLAELTTGDYNAAFGSYSLNVVTTGSNNLAMGSNSLASLTSGRRNVAVGVASQETNGIGIDNVSVGQQSLNTFAPATAVGENVAVGSYSLQGLTTGTGFVVAGHKAGYSATTSKEGIFLGHKAGYYETGDAKLVISSQSFGSEAADRVGAIIYGEMNSTVASQILRVNAQLQAYRLSSTTAAADNVAVIDHDSSGTPAKGFGAGLAFTLKSTTTANQGAARIVALWDTATHASRKADLILFASDSAAEREGFRIHTTGSAVQLGFWGSAPAARQTLLSYTTDDQSSSYAGIDNSHSGEVYAKIEDLNTLRAAYENLRGMVDELRSAIQTTTLIA